MRWLASTILFARTILLLVSAKTFYLTLMRMHRCFCPKMRAAFQRQTAADKSKTPIYDMFQAKVKQGALRRLTSSNNLIKVLVLGVEVRPCTWKNRGRSLTTKRYFVAICGQALAAIGASLQCSCSWYARLDVRRLPKHQCRLTWYPQN